MKISFRVTANLVKEILHISHTMFNVLNSLPRGIAVIVKSKGNPTKC